jgi:hypothetical protein
MAAHPPCPRLHPGLVDGVEYVMKGNVAMEARNGEPYAKKVSWDEACDSVPNLWRNRLNGGNTKLEVLKKAEGLAIQALQRCQCQGPSRH